jgi:hypothetical protein
MELKTMHPSQFQQPQKHRWFTMTKLLGVQTVPGNIIEINS